MMKIYCRKKIKTTYVNMQQFVLTNALILLTVYIVLYLQPTFEEHSGYSLLEVSFRFWTHMQKLLQVNF